MRLPWYGNWNPPKVRKMSTKEIEAEMEAIYSILAQRGREKELIEEVISNFERDLKKYREELARRESERKK